MKKKRTYTTVLDKIEEITEINKIATYKGCNIYKEIVKAYITHSKERGDKNESYKKLKNKKLYYQFVVNYVKKGKKEIYRTGSMSLPQIKRIITVYLKK